MQILRYDSNTKNTVLVIDNSIAELNGKLLNRKLDLSQVEFYNEQILELRAIHKRIRVHFSQIVEDDAFKRAEAAMAQGKAYDARLENKLNSLPPKEKRKASRTASLPL